MNHRTSRNRAGPHDERLSRTRDCVVNQGPLVLNNSTLKFKSSVQNIRKQSTDEIRSIQMEEMKSQKSLRRHEASVVIKSAYIDSEPVR